MKSSVSVRLLSCLVIALLAIYSIAYAQEPLQRYVITEAGVARHILLDKGASPLLYKGTAVHAGLGYLHLKNKYVHRVQLLFDAGSIRPDIKEVNNNQKVNLMKAGLRYTYERQALYFGQNKYLLRLGAEWGTLASLRNYMHYINNNLNYDFASWLALKSSLQRRLKIKQKQLDVSAGIAIPIVAFVARPSFASSIPPGYFKTGTAKIKTFFKSGDIVSLDHWQLIRTYLSLTYHLPNSNALRLAYEWEFYNYNKIPVNRVSAAAHMLSLAMLFSF